MVSDRPAYFVVSRIMGRPQPAIYWDELPRTPIRNLDYVVRLDQLPNADKLVNAPLVELFAAYLSLRAKNALPPRWEPPQQRKATLQIGS